MSEEGLSPEATGSPVKSGTAALRAALDECFDRMNLPDGTDLGGSFAVMRELDALNDVEARLEHARVTLWRIYVLAGEDTDGNTEWLPSQDACASALAAVRQLRTDYDADISYIASTRTAPPSPSSGVSK